MALRMKLHANRVALNRNAQGGFASEEITLGPIYGHNEENRAWSTLTPYAELKATITNPAAFGAVEPGAEYYVTIERAHAALGSEKATDGEGHHPHAG